MDKKCLLVIRIRGEINAPYRIRDTLRMLRIDKKNYATLIDNRPSYLGMLHKVKDYVTWGEPSLDTIELLLEKRNDSFNGKKTSNEALKKLEYHNYEELAQDIFNGEVEFNKLNQIKPFFRLHPPKGGFKKSIKRNYGNKGELGYRGKDINNLARRMC